MATKLTGKSKTAAKKAKPASRSHAEHAMPHFDKAPNELVRTFATAMRHFPDATQRKTFGHPSAFVNGNMFGGLHGDKVIVRLSPEDGVRLPGGRPFEPMPGRPMKNWYVLPPAVLESPADLNAWLERAREFVQALPPKRKGP